MGEGRLRNLYTLKENLYAAKDPVMLTGGTLFQDSGSGDITAEIGLVNNSEKTVSEVDVLLNTFDADKRLIDIDFRFSYRSLTVAKRGRFGKGRIIHLADPAIRSFTARVSSIKFADGSEWLEDLSAEKDLLVEQLDAVGRETAERIKHATKEMEKEKSKPPSSQKIAPALKDARESAGEAASPEDTKTGMIPDLAAAAAAQEASAKKKTEKPKKNKPIFSGETGRHSAASVLERNRHLILLISVILLVILAVAGGIVIGAMNSDNTEKSTETEKFLGMKVYRLKGTGKNKVTDNWQFYYYTKKAKHITMGGSYGSASKEEKEYTYRVQEPRLGKTKILLTSTANKSEKILYLSKNRKAIRDKESNQTYKLLVGTSSDS
jgi:hypothetical protein